MIQRLQKLCNVLFLIIWWNTFIQLLYSFIYYAYVKIRVMCENNISLISTFVKKSDTIPSQWWRNSKNSLRVNYIMYKDKSENNLYYIFVVKLTSNSNSLAILLHKINSAGNEYFTKKISCLKKKTVRNDFATCLDCIH